MKSKKTSLSPSFLKSLVNYMAVGGAIVGSINQAQATIQYSTLSGTPMANATATIPTPGGGSLKIRNRGAVINSVEGAGSASIAGSGGWQVNRHGSGVNVSTAAGVFNAPSYRSQYLGYASSGQFPNTTGGFIAVRFNNGGLKFGWIRIDVAANGTSFTLVDWAYQDDGTAISTGDLPLPIELYAFDAQLKKGDAVLEWTSTREENFDGFSIERAEEGIPFAEIEWIAGQGNSNEAQDYRFIDQAAIENKKYYYRLKMVDLDGSADYSPIVELATSNVGFTISEPYPNPVVGESFSIDIQTKTDEEVAIRLFSTTGQLIYEGEKQLNPGLNSFEIAIPELASGTYFVKVQGRYYSNYQSIIVQ
ncbi:MAG: T9SS type A sorting domain-containing protein [Bacteroidia bacterium]